MAMHAHQCGMTALGWLWERDGNSFGCGHVWQHDDVKSVLTPGAHYCPNCGKGPFTFRIRAMDPLDASAVTRTEPRDLREDDVGPIAKNE